MLLHGIRLLSKEDVRLAAISMYCSDVSIPSIAESLNISQYMITSAIRRFILNGITCDRPRGGRNTKVTNRDTRHIKYTAMRTFPYSMPKLTTQVREETGINVTRHKVEHTMKQYGFKRMSDRIAVKQGPEWKKARRQFYYNNLNTNWDNVVFSDEKVFGLNSNGRIKFYARSYEEYQEKHHNVPLNLRTKCKVWGAISRKGVGPLIHIDTTMNSQQYVDEILQHVIGTKAKRAALVSDTRDCPSDFTWQQDNAGFHRGPPVMTFFEDNDINVIDWPSGSPDLSPIENVWNIIQYRLRLQQIETSSIAPEGDMFNAIEDIWYSITPEMCINLIDSMPDRLNELFRRQYNVIDY